MAGEERYDLWRKQGFICRPFSSEIKDGTRFLDDYLEQAQKYPADDDWMEDDVLLGKDQGGDDPTAPPMPAINAAGHAAAVAARRKRLKKTAARFLDHAGATMTIKTSLKAADAAVDYCLVPKRRLPASRRARWGIAPRRGRFGRQLLAPRSGPNQLLHPRQSWNCV